MWIHGIEPTIYIYILDELRCDLTVTLLKMMEMDRGNYPKNVLTQTGELWYVHIFSWNLDMGNYGIVV